mmetsp:Transcript_27043/g.72890  ORF Transcript_27043/g.72890 Transcript_27043/m.72890 type:complete len:237 (-) Transcript_27043:412-1122(-)
MLRPLRSMTSATATAPATGTHRTRARAMPGGTPQQAQARAQVLTSVAGMATATRRGNASATAATQDPRATPRLTGERPRSASWAPQSSAYALTSRTPTPSAAAAITAAQLCAAMGSTARTARAPAPTCLQTPAWETLAGRWAPATTDLMARATARARRATCSTRTRTCASPRRRCSRSRIPSTTTAAPTTGRQGTTSLRLTWAVSIRSATTCGRKSVGRSSTTMRHPTGASGTATR